ncbi:GNAT family N-acetyltransferase [Nocardiopsis dassonvillei]|uniref:GNAT family N-acetyltransferase n=1 Tax=Nocardiopsis dassonvillei TaxID=2014 RepID=UPI003F55AAE4
MRVRPAASAELPALRALAARAGAAYAPDGDVLLVAEIDGVVVGWLSGTLAGAYPGPGAPVPAPRGYVQAVVVATAARRAGISRELLEEFVATARQARVAWVFAVPGEGLGAAGQVGWLSACGFAPVVDSGEIWPVMGRWTGMSAQGQP